MTWLVLEKRNITTTKWQHNSLSRFWSRLVSSSQETDWAVGAHRGQKRNCKDHCGKRQLQNSEIAVVIGMLVAVVFVYSWKVTQNYETCFKRQALLKKGWRKTKICQSLWWSSLINVEGLMPLNVTASAREHVRRRRLFLPCHQASHHLYLPLHLLPIPHARRLLLVMFWLFLCNLLSPRCKSMVFTW